MSVMPRESEVVVVGAGILGLSTAYALLERGVDVVVYEQGAPGGGQSGGVSRIFRHAHDDPRLVAAAVDSRTVYDEWGERLGVELVSGDGAVAIGPAALDRLPALERAGVPARRVDPDELARRLPVLAGFDGPAVLDEQGGSIRTTAAVRALAGALGDRLVTDEVLALRPVGDDVEVRTGGETHRCHRAVVCAGRGTAHLARSVGVVLPVHEGAHVRLTFDVRGPAPTCLSTLQDSSGRFGETGVYAAAAPGNTAYAVGLSASTAARDDASLVAPGELADLAERAAGYVRRALTGLDPTPVDVRHCWVTELPWGPDGVAVWEHGGILFPAGHNLFKQAPGLGRRLAARAAGGPVDQELDPAARLGAP